tara:strand:+ start:530 stop:1405 length:876 start_codon:yes stop_codon:yes gene_type:complete
MSKKAYYAVFRGHSSNTIVNSWDECKKLVHGFKGAIYKKHLSETDAKQYLLSLKNSVQSNFPLQNADNVRKIPTVTDKTRIINIYTDGSLIRKEKESYAGYGIYIPVDNYECSCKLDGKKTNNRAELRAIINSIQLYKKEDDILLKIYTDSSYSIKIFGETGLKYRKNNYKTKSKEVPNSDLVKIAVELADEYNLEFIHVNSHTNKSDVHSLGNDRADKLAVRGAVKDYIESNENLGDFKLTFGKHKNIPISLLPKNYLLWIAESDSFEKLCVCKEEYRLEKEIIIHYLKS